MDNLNRAKAILVFTQGFALGDKVGLSTRATAGLYWSLECAINIIGYEAGNKEHTPANPIIDSIDYTGTISNILDVNALFQQMHEINEVDKWICEGMAFVTQCIGHALAYHDNVTWSNQLVHPS